jgi:hypothetical protein
MIKSTYRIGLFKSSQKWSYNLLKCVVDSSHHLPQLWGNHLKALTLKSVNVCHQRQLPSYVVFPSLHWHRGKQRRIGFWVMTWMFGTQTALLRFSYLSVSTPCWYKVPIAFQSFCNEMSLAVQWQDKKELCHIHVRYPNFLA